MTVARDDAGGIIMGSIPKKEHPKHEIRTQRKIQGRKNSLSAARTGVCGVSNFLR
jgi:hypothetical protein